ncbi:hypothetical protein PtA15_6A450 [Puccinia triticina]|uniref:DM2 domain-containing protein n=1 Tax=Puccinia triticina TaxID=208348 RepID=A0ABY7CKR6_9BASI|nr:uncharacterized protein PtA15_6A450 [Puccinia triticina]WAQ85821.1 hypothetical protein PtA15_6A450 [Puccinia triticina]
MKTLRRFRPTDRNLPAFEPANPKAPRYSLEGLLPERQDGLHRIAKNYEKLQKIEREFDWLISRKRFEIEDSLRRPHGVQRRLRIKVWNTVANQPWQLESTGTENKSETRPSSDEGGEDEEADAKEKESKKDGQEQKEGEEDQEERKEDNDQDDADQQPKQPAAPAINFNAGEGVPKWTLHIEGHLIDPKNDSDHPMDAGESSEPGSAQQPKIDETRRPFSTLLNSLLIKIDRSDELYPEPNIVDWHRPPTPTPIGAAPAFSAITLTRNGTEDCNLQIALHLNHFPRRFRLNPILGSFLDLQEASLDEIFESIWCYIKKNKLIDSGADKRLIRKDSNLACLFPQNVDRMLFHQLFEQVRKYMTIPEPVIIDYQVKVDKEDQGRAEYFDIQFSIEDPAKLHLLTIQNQLEDIKVASLHQPRPDNPINPTKEILAIDEQIMDSMSKIREVKIRRDFYQQFTRDPIGFIEEWIRSQSSDLEVLFGLDKGGEGTSVETALSAKKRKRGDDDGLNEAEHEKRYAKFYHQRWVDDALQIYQSREFNGRVHQASQKPSTTAPAPHHPLANNGNNNGPTNNAPMLLVNPNSLPSGHMPPNSNNPGPPNNPQLTHLPQHMVHHHHQHLNNNNNNNHVPFSTPAPPPNPMPINGPPAMPQLVNNNLNNPQAGPPHMGGNPNATNGISLRGNR